LLSFLKKYHLLFSIGLLSAAIIAFQLALMQILSIMQWYHFAYMVISVALLGFGAAGSFLAVFRERLLKHINWLLPNLMIATGLAMALVTDVSQTSFVRFDSYLLFTAYSQLGKLLLTYLLFFIPFFLGALAIGLIFVRHVSTIGRIYFANLLGSGAGGILTLALIWLFFPNQLPACLAVLPVGAGIFLLPHKKRLFQLVFAFVAVAVIIWKFLQPPQLVLSQYKELSKTLLLPEATIQMEKPSPYGLTQTVTSPVLRYAPGLSLTAQTTAQVRMAAFTNGDWFGAFIDYHKADTSFILDYTTFALPYIMAPRNRVLVLRAGTGIDVAHARSRGAESITAVEPNKIILSISPFSHPEVRVQNVEPRTFLMMDTSHYDLINLPIIGTFGGSSGLFALQEQFILTKEALREMWMKLNPGGAVSLTSWMDYPVRNPLKILATMAEVLADVGIQDPTRHIAAIRSWGTITFVMTKSPLQEQEIANIRRFSEEMLFDPALLPQLDPEERDAYNEFQDTLFFNYLDRLLSPQRELFYDTYDFNIRPATDNKPFFSQYIRWKHLDRVASFFGNQSLPFFELGYLLIVITLLQITLVSFVLTLLPLLSIGWQGKDRGWILLYFGGIGIGFMFVEMVFIQRFILYFGNPIYSASAVITSILIFSGVGSYFSRYFTERKRLLLLLGLIVFLLFIYSFVFTPVLQQTVHFQLALKLVIVFLLTAPLAFCMGIPFPAGLLQLPATATGEIAWAWGLNGCFSVISTALATIVAVEMGFKWVMLLAAFAYCLPLMAMILRLSITQRYFRA
jgi:hypothetical protein